MASRRFSAGDDTVARDECTGNDRLHRYRLIVLAGGVGEVVESAGGFLCDRARAGWDVSVILSGFLDRPFARPGTRVRCPSLASLPRTSTPMSPRCSAGSRLVERSLSAPSSWPGTRASAMT